MFIRLPGGATGQGEMERFERLAPAGEALAGEGGDLVRAKSRNSQARLQRALAFLLEVGEERCLAGGERAAGGDPNVPEDGLSGGFVGGCNDLGHEGLFLFVQRLMSTLFSRVLFVSVFPCADPKVPAEPAHENQNGSQCRADPAGQNDSGHEEFWQKVRMFHWSLAN